MITLLELPVVSPPEFTAQIQEDSITVWSPSSNAVPKVTIFLENSPLVEGGDLIRVPIPVTIISDENGFQANNDAMGVYGIGESPSKAINDFINLLSDTWDGLKSMKRHELTHDAIELRDRIAYHLGGPLDAESGRGL